MPEDREHIIQKVKAKLVLSTDKVHREKSDQLKRAVQNALENLAPVFDGIAGESFIRMDSLSVEINLPDVDFNQLEKKIENAVKEKVKQSIHSQPDISESELHENTEYVSKDKRYYEILSVFLNTGRLPWWADKYAFDEAGRWLTDLPADQCKSFVQTLITDSYKKDRFLRQLPPKVVQEVMKKILSDIPAGEQIMNLQQEVLKFVRSEFHSHVVYEQMRKELSSKIMSGSAAGLSYQNLTKDLLSEVIVKFIEIVENRDDSQRYIKKLKDWFHQAEHPDTKLWIEQVSILSENENRLGWKEDKQRLQTKDASRKAVEAEHFDRNEGIRANNAGVVILHPFLTTLFKNLGYTEGGEFLNEAARERAVCLVYYLATGQKNFPEYELLVPKFICGWPLKVSVDRYLSLTEAEKDECKSVLLSCLQHWEALKSTSVNGLRKNFLQREGILKQEEFGWSLYIEEMAMDLLLDKLPWNLSLIKMKWMDEMITVHWR